MIIPDPEMWGTMGIEPWAKVTVLDCMLISWAFMLLATRNLGFIGLQVLVYHAVHTPFGRILHRD